MTNSLAHYWPNLWNARDEITGANGMVMGILPGIANGAPDEVAFNDETGWVQLPVNLQNSDEFTISVWLRPDTPKRGGNVALELHADQHRWWLQYQGGATYRLYAPGSVHPGIELTLPVGEWTHVAITKRGKGTTALWKNGAMAGEEHFIQPGNMPLDSATAGNSVKGDTQWHGHLSELRVFARALSPQEVRDLHAAGFHSHPAQDTPARRQTTRSPQAMHWSTNVSPSAIEGLSLRRYTTEDGLPGNKIQCLHQARDGYLWVGTDEGLARFDGRRFRTWTDQKERALAPVGNDIISLCEGEDGTLWAGGYGGLLRIRSSEITAFTNGLPEALIIAVAPGETNTLWVAGFRMDRNDRGPCRVRRYHPDLQTSSDQVVAPGHVRRIVPTPSGLWMATEDPEQLLFWDRSSPAPVVVAKLTGPPLEVNLRAEAPAPGLLAHGWRDPLDSERAYLEMVCEKNGPVFHWISPAPRATAAASTWRLPQNTSGWMGADTGLARRLGSGVERIVFPDDAAPRQVTSVSPNREGGVWVGTDGDGLYLVREKLVRVFTKNDGLGGNDIRSVVAIREGAVLASGPAGVYQLQGGRWQGMASVPLPLESVLSLAQDLSGRLWAGLDHYGSDALVQVGPTKHWFAFVLPGVIRKHPSTMTVSPRGTLWVGDDLGLTWVTPPDLPLNELPGHQIPHGRLLAGENLPDVKFLKLVADRDDSLWVGTLGKGLLRVVSEKVEVFTKDEGLPFDDCSPALLDDTGALWIVTSGAVVRRSNGRFQVVDKRHGVPDDILLDIIEDDEGYFWVPGHRGIHRLKRSELEAVFDGQASNVHSVTIGVRDGLLTPECTSVHYPVTAKTSDGRIWVATRGGLATFDPREAHINTQPLPTMIEHVVAGRNQTFIPTENRFEKPLRLPQGSGRRLEIHYTATSLVAAERVKFRHQLQGHASEWSDETDLRQAFYTNLRPGRYTFRVMARNPHGVWNQEPTRLAFIIAPYFWQRPIFYAAVFLVLSAALLMAHRQRLSVLRRLQELDHQQQLLGERTRIAADMHDDLGAALTQIAILGEVAKNQITDTGRARSVLTRISESARDVTARMSDLVWATNPRNDTLDNLGAYLREQLATQLEEANLEPHLIFPEELPPLHLSPTFRRNILLTVKEALSNALKHAKATEFTAELKVELGQLMIRLEDNGSGFNSPNGRPFGNGLGNMRRRIEDLGGTMEIDTAPGQGTRIWLRVPMKRRSESCQLNERT